MNVMNNKDKITNVILSFPTAKDRAEFFATNCLEKYGISENTINTETDCSIDGVKLITIAKIIKFAKDGFGADFHLNCGGKNLGDCSSHERKHGSLCNYCQYMEFN